MIFFFLSPIFRLLNSADLCREISLRTLIVLRTEMGGKKTKERLGLTPKTLIALWAKGSISEDELRQAVLPSCALPVLTLPPAVVELFVGRFDSLHRVLSVEMP